MLYASKLQIAVEIIILLAVYFITLIWCLHLGAELVPALLLSLCPTVACSFILVTGWFDNPSHTGGF